MGLAPRSPSDPFRRHGGRLEAARRAWPSAPTPWIDLSTGINPWPYPAPRLGRGALARLPDPEDVTRLEARAAAGFGVADAGRVVAVAGAEAGLRLLPLLAPARTAAIACPTYGGHADAWEAAGAAIVPWPRAEDDAGAVVIVNPNNPDGRLYHAGDLLALADRLGEREGMLVVDESFADFTSEVSVASADRPALVVLRSFGKAYGLAGARLGFVVASPSFAALVRRAVGDWPVSAPALSAGLAAYADITWLERTRVRLARTAADLDAWLGAAGFDVVGGTALFRLARAPDVEQRFVRLCEQGVLTRPFEGRPDLLRFGLPHAREQGRVRRALAAL